MPHRLTLSVSARRRLHHEEGVTPVAGEIVERPAPIPRLAHVDAVRNVLHQQCVQGAVGEHPRSSAEALCVRGCSRRGGLPARASNAERGCRVFVTPGRTVGVDQRPKVGVGVEHLMEEAGSSSRKHRIQSDLRDARREVFLWGHINMFTIISGFLPSSHQNYVSMENIRLLTGVYGSSNES